MLRHGKISTVHDAYRLPVMKRLYDLLGLEHDLAEVGRELRSEVRGLGAQAVGALQVTCSDESEHECTQTFERTFAHEMLPRLKYGERVPFRIANPGARYEWGGARIAEDHFATDEAARGFKVMVVKINGHVALAHAGADGHRFGRLNRYDRESTYCGAIHALFDDVDLPFAEDLREELRSGGTDRLALLADPALAVDGRHALFGALCSARLQARRCAMDIQDHSPAGPTLYVVMHGVTLNKPGPDSELLGGIYVLDHRDGRGVETYRGIGDDPSAYGLAIEHGRVRVTDPSIHAGRPARDHRALARGRLRGMGPAAAVFREAAAALLGRARHERTKQAVVSKTLVRALLAVAAATSPVAAALLLVAEGAVGIHYATKLNRAGTEDEQAALARDVLASVHERLDELPPGIANRVVDGLLGAPGAEATPHA